MSRQSEEANELQLLAEQLLDVVPTVMRSIRRDIRAHRNAELSVPQFRVLNYVEQRPVSSLSEIAEHMGLAAPSVSKMVDGLVQRGLMKNERVASDRRRAAIAVTARGRTTCQAARRAARNALITRLGTLDPVRRAEVRQGLAAIEGLFSEHR